LARLVVSDLRETAMSEQVKATTACPDCGHGLRYPRECSVSVCKMVPEMRAVLMCDCGCNGGGQP